MPNRGPPDSGLTAGLDGVAAIRHTWVVSVLQIVGVVLIVIGIAEFPLFRRLGRDRPELARRQLLLDVAGALIVVLGALVFMVGW